MLCPHCGQINRAGANVCERCGRALAAMPSAIPFQAPSAPAARLSPATFQAAVPVAINNAPVPPAKRGRVPETIMQCRVCGEATSVRAACQTCGAPPGLIANPGDPTGGTFLSLMLSYPPPMDAIQVVPDRPLPPALSTLRWNWGACGASLLWLAGHRIVGWALIVLMLDAASLLSFYGPLYLLLPCEGALLSLALGAQGNFLAWQQRPGMDEATFLRSQTRWKWAGLIILPLKLILLAWLTWAAFNHR